MSLQTRVAVAALAVALPALVYAQARAGDEASPAPSPLAPLYAQFEDTLGPALVGVDDAAGRWLSGRLATLEPAAQIRDYAAAVAREPKEFLYVASLADACMAPGGALAPGCTDRDPVGYWASRDADNAVPWLLQAERARRRNNVPAMLDNLERAARSTEYSTYEARAGAVVWKKLASLVAPENRAAAALYALDARQVSGAALLAVENLCSPASRALDPRIGAACARLASLMANSATTFADRRAGTQLALNLAATDAVRAAASEQARTIVSQQDRCREAVNGMRQAASGAPAQRAAAATRGEQLVVARARDGEPAACAAMAKR